MTLEVRNLGVMRGGRGLLVGVSFRLQAGQALILRGPNGVGKTTLLRTIVGLQPSVSGEVIGTEDRVVYSAHSDGLKSMLSVDENLTFWADVFGGADIAAARAAFDLDALTTRLAGTLSAGQKRRLGLARLLVTKRPIWVLDEPTISLDAQSVALFAQAVRAHLKQGGMAVIATHIDLGLTDAQTLDITQFIAQNGSAQIGASDEAFL